MKNIIILGSGRSGTSLLAGSFHQVGYFIGTDYIAPRCSNPKGFFEGLEINTINEKILAASGYCPAPQRWRRILPDILQSGSPTYGQLWLARVPLEAELQCDEKTSARIAELAAKQPFCFKDPRFCYTLPAWRSHLNNTIFLCIFRHPAISISSIMKECHTRSYLKSLRMTPKIAEEIWQLQYLHVLDRHRHDGHWQFIHYDQLFDAGFRQKISDFVGSPINHGFAERRLSRSKPSYPVNYETLEVYQRLCSLASFQ